MTIHKLAKGRAHIRVETIDNKTLYFYSIAGCGKHFECEIRPYDVYTYKAEQSIDAVSKIDIITTREYANNAKVGFSTILLEALDACGVDDISEID